MNAAQATAILAEGRRPACVMVTRGGRTHMRCLHCGAQATEHSGEAAERRYRDHVDATCPTTRRQ